MKVPLLKILLICIFSIPSIGSFSQSDSLKNAYYSQSGQEQILTGLNWCASLENEPAEMLKLSQELLEKSKKTETPPLLLGKILKAISDSYFFCDSLEKSIEYGDHALNIALSADKTDSAFIAGIYNDVGMVYNEIENFTKAFEYVNKSVILYVALKSDEGISDSKSNLSVLYFGKGKFEDAIRLSTEVYQIDLKRGNVSKQVSSLNNLGRMYVEWGKYETGIEYYKKSVELLDTKTDHDLLSIRYNNIGVAYQMMGKHKEAIEWIKKALKIDQEEKSELKTGIRQFNLGNSYLALHDFTNAKQNLEKSAIYFEKIKAATRLSKVYASLGMMYSETGHVALAEKYLTDAQKLAETGKTLPEMENVYLKLYQFYKKLGDPAKTLKYFELQTNIKDSIYNLKAARQIEELEAQYQNEKKEAEITKLETENLLRQKEIKFHKRERNFATAGLIALAALLVVMFYLFYTIKKQKTELAFQNAKLDQLYHTQNQLFRIVSHDLKNVASAYQASAKIIQYHLGKGQPEKLLPVSEEISKNAHSLSSMLGNLLDWATIQMKGIEPEKKLIGLGSEFEFQKSIFSEAAEKKQISLNSQCSNETVWCDPESFRLILRNLISNAIKFTSSGEINIRASKSGNYTVITIADTGIGMDLEAQKNLFGPVSIKSRKGTSGEHGTGLGLILVFEHIQKNNGKIEVESVENKGTVFTLSLPSELI